MGCDIHSFVEVKKDGKWIKEENALFDDGWNGKSTSPFDWRHYAMFSFFAGVREKLGIEQLSEPRGLPDDSECLNEKLDKPYEMYYNFGSTGFCKTVGDEILYDVDYHSHSYLLLKELVDFDYSKKLDYGDCETYADLFSDAYFNNIETLKTLGNPEDVRFVFWFDN